MENIEKLEKIKGVLRITTKTIGSLPVRFLALTEGKRVITGEIKLLTESEWQPAAWHISGEWAGADNYTHLKLDISMREFRLRNGAIVLNPVVTPKGDYALPMITGLLKNEQGEWTPENALWHGDGDYYYKSLDSRGDLDMNVKKSYYYDRIENY